MSDLFAPTVVTALGDPGGSGYYRILLPTFLASAHGHIQLRMPEKFFVFYPVDFLKVMRPDTVLLHRTHTEEQRKYVNKLAHELDILKVYTIDDWVGKVPKESPHFKSKQFSNQTQKEIKKLINLCDRVIVTNDVLASVHYKLNRNVTIIPNYLSKVVWDQAYALKRPERSNDKPRIGWSGGMGHPGDLKILREVADILGDKVQWVFLGMTPDGFNEANSEIHKPVPPAEYAKALYNLDLDIALAPLLDNDFNRAKSNLRILEYGAAGFPVIASNVPTYRNTPATLLEYNAKWWANEISNLLTDRDVLKAEGEFLKKWVWENYCLDDHIGEYAKILSPSGEGFFPSKPDVEDIVDVVITTRNNTQVVKDCIESVLKSIPENTTKTEIIITDNASTESDLIHYLHDLKDNKQATVLFSDKDYGYVNNINKGISVHDNRDVITLNSDVYVNGNWIDRLREYAYKHERIASVTPLTNQGTILSYPNPAGSELQKGLVKFYDDLAKSELSTGEIIDLPTNVGFCSYIRRSALAEVGVFDSHAFDRGYAEENDWSMRNISRGYKNIVALNVYVGHRGAASFGKEKEELMKRSAATLMTRWQQYSKLIEGWLQANPLAMVKQNLDLGAIAKSAISNRTLYISHSYGGGLETYLQNNKLSKEPGVLVIRNDLQKLGFFTLEVVGEKYYNLPQLNTRLTDLNFMRDLIKRFRINKISVQTTFGYEYNFPIWIENLAKHANIPYEIMFHDYWTVCPRLRLVDKTSYCGEPDVSVCNNCVIMNGSGVGQVNVYAWREMYKDFLYNACNVFAPSKDTATRLNKYFPLLDIQVVPHEETIEIGEWDAHLDKLDADGMLRVAVIGNISPDKGSLVVRDCAQYCLEESIPVKFLVFGSLLDNSSVLKMIPPNNNLTVFGPYEEANLKNMLELNKCHMSFFSAQWPETYSYTLSTAFKCGLWPVCYNIGAIAERIKDMNFGTILPFEMSKDPKKTVDELLKIGRERHEQRTQ